MTIREVFEDLMAGRGQGLDPAAVLEGYGFGDLSPEALSTALGHFAERSPMEVADALAPIVSRLSEVPFDEGDLPFSAEAESILSGGDGLMELLADLDVPTGEGLEADPSEFDVVGELTDVVEAAESGDGSLDGLADEVGARFGLGGDDLDELADGLDLPESLDLDLADVTDVADVDEPNFEQTADSLLGGLAEQVDLPDDLDPDDLDFDLD